MLADIVQDMKAQIETLNNLENSEDPQHVGRRIIAVKKNLRGDLVALGISKDGDDVIAIGLHPDFSWSHGSYFPHRTDFYHGYAVETFRDGFGNPIWYTDEYVALAREIRRGEF